MQLTQAIAEFVGGYFSTHERSQKTKTAYASDLEQFRIFVGTDLDLASLDGSLIETWAAHLRMEEYIRQLQCAERWWSSRYSVHIGYERELLDQFKFEITNIIRKGRRYSPPNSWPAIDFPQPQPRPHNPD